MPVVYARQHLFSSVEQGFFAQQGRGFQTVAISPELVGTEDLRILEQAAFYALRRERLTAAGFPVREYFFQLSSGNFAVGRAIWLGTDSLGREGNYLAHHLILTPEDFLCAGADAFTILDQAAWATAATDLNLRDLPALKIEWTADEGIPPSHETSFQQLARLIKCALNHQRKSALLIGKEAEARHYIRAVISLLTLEKRMQTSFCTHFYDSHHLRSLFGLCAISSPEELPAETAEYFLCNLDADFPEAIAENAYVAWLAECLRAERLQEVSEINDLLNEYRHHKQPAGKRLPSLSPGAAAALWEGCEEKILPLIPGNAENVNSFLSGLRAPRQFADLLLKAVSPSQLFNEHDSFLKKEECLALLRAAASPKTWNEWMKRWGDDPVLSASSQRAYFWWERWKR